MVKGDSVSVVSCPECEILQGKVGVVKEVNEAGDKVRISFGKGRPQKGRPEWFNVSGLQVSVQSNVGLQVNGL
jgi:hypothetical protein